MLVQGQHAHFIEQYDPFTYLGVKLTMSLNWTHQYTRMTETFKQKLTGLRNSYASPWQAIRIINGNHAKHSVCISGHPPSATLTD
jgi:hypothetical protein